MEDGMNTAVWLMLTCPEKKKQNLRERNNGKNGVFGLEKCTLNTEMESPSVDGTKRVLELHLHCSNTEKEIKGSLFFQQ